MPVTCATTATAATSRTPKPAVAQILGSLTTQGVWPTS